MEALEHDEKSKKYGYQKLKFPIEYRSTSQVLVDTALLLGTVLESFVCEKEFRTRMGAFDVQLTFNEIAFPNEDVVVFMSSYEWPFHTNPNPTAEQARIHLRDAPDSRIFMIGLGGIHAAMLRILELEDLIDGCPVFDLRRPLENCAEPAGED